MDKLDPQLSNLLEDFNEGSINIEELSDDPRFIVPEAGDAPKVGIFLGYTDDITRIQELGFEARTVTKNIASGFVDIDKVETIAALDNVINIEMSQLLFPELDLSVPDIQADVVHTGPPGFKGANVIVGVIDSGVDYRHQCFRDENGESRILFIWDQTIKPTDSDAPKDPITGKPIEKPPEGFKPPLNYGVEYNKAQIDEALRTGDPLKIVRQKDERGHGTKVAGVAAGNGSAVGNCTLAGTFIGVAPEADLIVVKLRGPDTDEADAVNYIFTKAALRDRPAVINVSWGGPKGAHDGTDSLEQLLDGFLFDEEGLLDFPGRAMIKSAGNMGYSPDEKCPVEGEVERRFCHRHASGTVGSGSTEEVRFTISKDHKESSLRKYGFPSVRLELWYEGDDLFAFTITPPKGKESDVVSAGDVKLLTLSNANVARVSSQLNPSVGKLHSHPDNRIIVQILPGSRKSKEIQAGEWRFKLSGTKVTTDEGGFHCWITKGAAEFAPPRDNQVSHRDNRCTIGIPGTSKQIITVGSYINKGDDVGNLANSSSRGPTRDGDLKPEITAPGSAIMTTLSLLLRDNSWWRCSACCYDQYMLASGTSFAAPHVAGVVALMLQKNPSLTQGQIRAALTSTARKDDFTGVVPNNDWGHGKVDALAAVNAVDPITTFPTSASSAPASPALGPSGSPARSGSAPVLSFHQERLRRAQTEITQTPGGQLYATLIRKHQQEIRRLLDTNRRVATVWHRSGGPLLMREALEAVRWPDRPLPTIIEEQPVVERIRRILAIFKRYGSPALVADIDHYGSALLQLSGLSYDQILARLSAWGSY